MRPVPLVLALPVVALPAPAVDPPPAYEQMAIDLLRQYLQVDTTNPPGNELKALQFYKRRSWTARAFPPRSTSSRPGARTCWPP